MSPWMEKDKVVSITNYANHLEEQDCNEGTQKIKVANWRQEKWKVDIAAKHDYVDEEI